MEEKIKYLELIENIITRMAKNSFMLKGWTMTLVVAICGLASQGSNLRFIMIAFLPIVMFWILDSYYLWQERKFRALYSEAAKLKENTVDFNLNLGKEKIKKNKKLNLFLCIFSFTEMLFYFPILITIIILTVLVF